MKRIAKYVAVSLSGVASLATSAAVAQEAKKAEQAGSSTRSTVSQQDIVVTANKMNARSASDTPIAVSAFSQDMLDNMGAKGLSDFLQTAPGVGIIETAPGNNYIQIRGASSNYGDATVGFYLNDLPFALIGSGELPSASALDLERVEVLRGPQGTLYGAGSLGGTIRILTKQPELTKFSGNASASYSTINSGGDTFRGSGVLNVPIIEDKLAVRFAAAYEDVGGYIDAPLLGMKDINKGTVEVYRGQLKWAATDNLEANISAWIYRNKADSSGLTSASAEDDYDLNLAFPLSNISNYDLYNGTLSWDVAGISIYSATSYMTAKGIQTLDFFSAPGFPITSDIKTDVFSQETRITSSNESRLSWLLGGFYSNTKQQARIYTVDDNPFVGPVFLDTNFSIASSMSKQYSVFGQVAYELVPDKLKASVGLRYFKNDKSDHESAATAVLFIGFFGLSPTRKASYKDVSPRFNLAYTPTDDTLIYATIAKGFRSGVIQAAFNLIIEFPNVPNFVPEETLWSYELGVKHTALGGQLYGELAGYYNKWSDLQAIVSSGYLNTSGNARSYGLDFLFDLKPAAVEGLSLQVSGNWNDSSYTSVIPGAVVRVGDRVDLVPKWTLNGSINYIKTLADELTGTLYLGAQYMSKRENRGIMGLFVGDDITLVTGRVGVETGRYRFAVFAENLLNENGNMAPNITRPFQVLRPRPRTVGAEVRVSF